MKTADEYTPFNKISAYIVLNKQGEAVAKVLAHFGESKVTVTVYNFDENRGSETSTASGCGYDKFTSALAGLTVAGHVMADHCDYVLRVNSSDGWARDAEPPRKGYFFCNYDSESSRYQSCWQVAGLDYLTHFGLKVIQVC